MLYAVDTETLGCNPKEESPIHKAELWCMTVAWEEDEEVKTKFVLRRDMGLWRDWLQSPRIQKIGSNILTYDKHVFANMDINLQGVVGDTILMSRLLNPSQQAGHSLKQWGERLGFQVTSFKELVSRPRHSLGTLYKKRRSVKKPWPTEYYPDTQVYNIHWLGKPEEMQLDYVWKNYPSRRTKIKEYAVQDAVMSLRVYEHLKQLLEKTSW